MQFIDSESGLESVDLGLIPIRAFGFNRAITRTCAETNQAYRYLSLRNQLIGLPEIIVIYAKLSVVTTAAEC